jgi:hypothetical protein
VTEDDTPYRRKPVSVTNWLYVVDYDVPSKNESRRVMFYQAVHRMLRKHLRRDAKFASYSCYFTEDVELARKLLAVVKEHNGKGNIYKAVKVQ